MFHRSISISRSVSIEMKRVHRIGEVVALITREGVSPSCFKYSWSAGRGRRARFEYSSLRDFCMALTLATELINHSDHERFFGIVRFNSSLYWSWQPEAAIATDILPRYRTLESVVLIETAPNEYPLTLPTGREERRDEKYHVCSSLYSREMPTT